MRQAPPRARARRAALLACLLAVVLVLPGGCNAISPWGGYRQGI